MKYTVEVTAVGDSVEQLLEMSGNLVLLNDTEAAAYKNMVVSHTVGELAEDIACGDTLVIGHQEYEVTEVGEDANQDLREQGHCTLVFGAGRHADQPGQIAVSGAEMPRVIAGYMVSFS